MEKIALALFIVFGIGCSHSLQMRQPALESKLTSQSLSPTSMPFVSRGTALALNIPYEPIKAARTPIEKVIERPLSFLTSWEPQGEAHVTTITPPEFNVLKQFLKIQDIEAIANLHNIQKSDIFVFGVGSGKKKIQTKDEETFFVIVDSQNLRLIRNEIWKAFVKSGGDPKAWDPTWFFPHITIGYTKTDIHEPDVYKNIRGSLDLRFKDL